ncbi:P-loop containing nucleoside triphosphate hydrolase protein [Dimargaris cristalligena]|uniref:Eukaryotic translation initiation factor 5B n=1 Tax=Dimargaris cristalligena TaxID=215637 RepID=A0A4P9ZMH7_9FUNG|nr:P-loop containing nucleoside triphosphate hydrolase protein [Dimargaris cristalligena]|eukprot:RKP34584.1 P-loop containing nucleoside triphosphate hydrolase protein [Dimargaris cristalligena]
MGRSKNKKKTKGKSRFAAPESEPELSESESEPEPEPEPEPIPTPAKKKGKGKKGKGAKVAEIPDFESEPEEVLSEEEIPPAPTLAQKKGKGKKGKAAAPVEEVKAVVAELPKKGKKGKAAAPVEPEPVPEPVAPTDAADSKKAPKGKKKNTKLTALQKMVEARKAAEEEAQRRAEEEKRRREEEERVRAEEEEREYLALKERKEQEKARKEKLRKEGKLLTKAQKEAQKRNTARLQQLLDSGVQVAGLQSKNAEDSDSKVKPAKGKGKGKGKGKKQEASPATAATAEADQSEDDSEDDNSDDDDSDDDSSDEEATAAERAAFQRKQEAAERREKRHQAALEARSADDLRSPICCILGHVDTGKYDYFGFCVDGNHRFLLPDLTVTHNTKLLDKIRQTNVQEGEAGGITQQIGATYFPMDAIKAKTALLNKTGKVEYKVPGLLVIDTPGHESFTNLRSRGSSLCNIAILVVDIMHGLEPQTLESIRLLRQRKTPFIVALNKIDRLYDWKPVPNNPFRDSLALQSKSVQREFETRVEQTLVAFAEQGLNACLYYKNKNLGKYVSLVPTSAISGEGIPDLLLLLVSLTQSRMTEKLMYLSELECTVLEVKVIEGLGTTIDVVLSNGVLNEGDRIVVCGLNGPITTNVRALLTPQPMRELRVKSAYVHHKTIKAAMGVKICAPDLEKAIAGSRLLVVGPDDDEEDLEDLVMEDLEAMINSIKKVDRGVYVQASTLGSLEALLEFLRTSEIPVSGINIGPVHKKDVMRAATMLDRAKEYAVMLCFDVKVDREVMELATDLGVKVFTAEIIYHLFDQFKAYSEAITEQKRKDQAPQAVFPCVLKMIPGAVFNKRDPIVIGVDVIEGALRTGTPVCVVEEDPETKETRTVSLGKVTSIEQNHKPQEIVKKGQAAGGVAIKIELPVYESSKMYGRHFTDNQEIYSLITRGSIDVLKESFRKDVSKDEWALIVRLKKVLNIA